MVVPKTLSCTPPLHTGAVYCPRIHIVFEWLVFGSLFSFATDMEVVPVPPYPVHGYLCNPEIVAWEISTSGG